MQENEKNINENEINESPLNETATPIEDTSADTENIPNTTESAENAGSADTAETPAAAGSSDSAADESESTPSESSSNALPLSVDGEGQELTDPQDLPKEPLYVWNYDTQKKLDAEKTKAKGKRGTIIYAVSMTAAFAVSFAVLLVLLLTNAFTTSQTPETPAPSETPVSTTGVVYVKEYSPDSGVLTTQEIYNKCLPSVVSVSVSNSSSSAIGSGFIISQDGFIVTANHVIADMSEITVILSNNQSYPAQLIAGNEFTDIALLKIEKTGLPALKIGKSSSLLVGDHVVAIGTPASIDFAGSLADGTVSYNNRVLKIYDDSNVLEKKMTLIQTNALVNPGNSGCPLINQYGEVVGIVTMKLNSTYFEGMCFAIPIDSAMPIINAMKRGQNYDALLSAVSEYPAKLGIMGETFRSDDDSMGGVKIVDFTSSSYDISKKMKVGDIITHVGIISVSSIEDLSRILDFYSPGDTIKITFYRSSQKMTVDVILGQ